MMVLFTYFFTTILKINFTLCLSNFDNKIRRKKSAQHNIIISVFYSKIMLSYLQVNFAKHAHFYHNKEFKSNDMLSGW